MKAKLVEDFTYFKPKTKEQLEEIGYLGQEIDSFEEKIYNPMSGQWNQYDYCKFNGSLIKKRNGKFVIRLISTIYHGDKENEYDELDIDIRYKIYKISKEFNTEDEAYVFLDNIELEYQGETKLGV